MGRYTSLVVLPATAAVLSLAVLICPRLPEGPRFTPLGAFAGASLLALGALGVLSPSATRGWPRAVLFGASAAALGYFAVFPATRSAGGVAIDLALVALAHAVGATIGEKVQSPGHILPAAAVAAAFDVISILHPRGPTHLLAESDRAIGVAVFAFPAPGTRAWAPSIGIGDLVFVALLLAVAAAHRISRLRVTLLALAGALLSGAASAALEAPFPALPAIGAAVVLGVSEARRVPSADRRVARLAMIGALVAATAVAIKERLLAP